MQGGGSPPIPQLPIPVPAFLSDNPYFSAGFGLAVMGFGLTVTRRLGVALHLLSQRSLLTTLEVHNRDPSYEWVVRWLESVTKGKSRRVVAETTKRTTRSGKSITSFSLVPSVGRHFVKYNGTWLMAERDRELRAKGGGGAGDSNQVWESIRLTTIGRSPEIYHSLMREAHDAATTRQMDFTTVYTSWGHEGWRPFGAPRRKRELSSVILDKGVAENVVNDAYEFLTCRNWYQQRGIPYRRGYLLYGTPGSGKSSFVSAFCGHVGYDICVMSLATPGLTDDHLAVSLLNVPEKAVVLFEDVDCLFEERHNSANTNYLTFSGFLNAIDGVSATEERIVFMTTNHVQRLDPALIRPGRVDLIQECADATEHQIGQLFVRFYPEMAEEKELCQRFVGAVSKRGISMAELQEYFLMHKTEPIVAVDDAHLWVKSVKSSVRHLNRDSHRVAHDENVASDKPEMRQILDLHLK